MRRGGVGGGRGGADVRGSGWAGADARESGLAARGGDPGARESGFGARGAPPENQDTPAIPADRHHSGAAHITAAPPPLWSVRDLALRYPGAPRPAVDGVSLDVAPGRSTAIIGPNGAGKSSLLQLLLGTLAPTAGAVTFAGRDLATWSRRELARQVGVLPQQEEVVFPLTVRELVAMGRYPHLGAWRREDDDDRRAIEGAMARSDVLALADRPVGTLSGGERQRARLARALAQEPTAFVLDEPTAALDVRHEMAIFELLPALCRQGATVLVVTHHLNLAARYADRLVLMHEGRVAADGPPAEVLTRETVERVYRWPVVVAPHPGPGPDAGAPQVVPLSAPHSPSEGT